LQPPEDSIRDEARFDLGAGPEQPSRSQKQTLPLGWFRVLSFEPKETTAGTVAYFSALALTLASLVRRNF